ncbi:RICIN domain-containing protein [Bacillus cereus]
MPCNLSNNGKALDVDDGSTEDGANVIVWTKTYGNNQKWSVNKC